MQKTRIKQIGKKGKQWIKDRAKLIKEALLEGRINKVRSQIFGYCEDCKKYKELDPDHKQKRSQGGSNDKSNIDWVCRDCHNKRDNMGDPKNKKIKNKKANWAVDHPCKKCKVKTSQLLCHNCGQLSV
jgi:hypothetical protein